MNSGVTLVRTNAEVDYAALERDIERRLIKAVGVDRPDPVATGSGSLGNKLLLLRGTTARLVATRLMCEKLARYPRLYRVVRRFYHARRESQ